MEKAEKVACALASMLAMPKPKKLEILHNSLDPICAYLQNIGRTKLLTTREEVDLLHKIQVRFQFNISYELDI